MGLYQNIEAFGQMFFLRGSIGEGAMILDKNLCVLEVNDEIARRNVRAYGGRCAV